LYTPPVAPTDFEWSGEPFGPKMPCVFLESRVNHIT
jgi:hypothetical protein